MTISISNSDDIIDSRDVIERIKELEELKEEFILNESETEDDSPSWGEISEANNKAEEEWNETEDGIELKNLLEFQEEFEGYCPDWKYGITLVRDSYWEEYCEDMVKDIGDLPDNIPHYIYSNIDWKGVAEDLQMDYTSGEWDGVTYWAR